jgi:dTDP-4-dehydrorhamnose reductase
MKVLLVTGGNGLLGSAIVRAASSTFEVYATYCHHASGTQQCEFVKLDLKDKQQTHQVLRKIKPQVVFHTAALRSIDYCEEHPEEAWAVNDIGTENAVLASKECKARFIHISTESVFDGNKGMYSEDDVPNPITVYGKTKLEAEKKVKQLTDYVVVRTSALYGWSLFGKSIAEWALAELREQKPIMMFTDSFFSPTLVENLAQALLEMANLNWSGILNIAGSERCSRFDFAKELARTFELNGELVLPSTLAESQLRVPRPRDLSLNASKASALLGTRLLNISDGLTWFKSEEARTSTAK